MTLINSNCEKSDVVNERTGISVSGLERLEKQGTTHRRSFIFHKTRSLRGLLSLGKHNKKNFATKLPRLLATYIVHNIAKRSMRRCSGARMTRDSDWVRRRSILGYYGYFCHKIVCFWSTVTKYSEFLEWGRSARHFPSTDRVVSCWKSRGFISGHADNVFSDSLGN